MSHVAKWRTAVAFFSTHILEYGGEASVYVYNEALKEAGKKGWRLEQEKVEQSIGME